MLYRRFNKIFSTFWNAKSCKANIMQTNFNFRNKNGYSRDWQWFKKEFYAYFLATTCYLAYYFHDRKKYVYAIDCPVVDTPNSVPKLSPHLTAPPIPQRPDLPTFTKSEVQKHKSREDRIWVTYQHGVYDITEYIEKHPGGDQIFLTAGKPVEGFWMVSAIHYKPHVLEMFEAYRIGNLRKEDVTTDFKKREIYLNEPKRGPQLIPLSEQPFNAGVSPGLLYEYPITPSENHFVRIHGPVPAIDLNKYVIEVVLHGKNKSLTLTLDELKEFPKYSVTAAIMCAGNRRDEMMKHKPLKALCWTLVAVGNSIWSGAKLSDILKKAGLTEEDFEEYNHVQFDGCDTDFQGQQFSMSIPMWKAVDKRGDVIIAYEMNGAPIPVDHGFPVRAIVPGFAGARSVKWLRRITAQPDECPSFNQQRLYKGFSPNIDYHNVDWAKSPVVNELPVTSAICDPVNGGKAKVADGKIEVKGYAFSGGGQKIIRVDVSSDRGENWHTADFTFQMDIKPPRHYAWTLWCCSVPVPNGEKSCEIWVKAVDSCYNTQPEKFEHIWNLRGVICNAYHKIDVNLI